MLQKPIKKDVVGEYEAKLVAGLSRRKLVACVVACAAGIGASALLGACWQVDAMASAYAGAALTVPVWYLGFVKPQDMKPEDFLPLWAEDRFDEQRIPFKSECAEMLAAGMESARRGVGIDRKAVKRERRLPEWASLPESRRARRLAKRVWRAKRRLACQARALAESASGGEGIGARSGADARRRTEGDEAGRQGVGQESAYARP